MLGLDGITVHSHVGEITLKKERLKRKKMGGKFSNQFVCVAYLQ